MFLKFREKQLGENIYIVGVFAISALMFAAQIFTFDQQQVSQFDKYLVAASRYLNGTIAPERILDYSPLYLFVNIFAFRFFASPLSVLLWLHIICLSLASVLLFLVLRRFAGAALSFSGIAAFIFGRSVVVYGYVFEPEPFMILFLSAVFFFGAKTGRINSLMTGVSLALALLTRPSFVPLIFLIPMYYWIISTDIRAAVQKIAIFMLPVIAGFLLIGIRNYTLQGFFSPMVMSPGTVFYDGNNPRSIGASAVYPPLVYALAEQTSGESDYQHVIYRDMARKSVGKTMDAGEANRYWGEKALHFVIDHPFHFIQLTAQRLYYIFHTYRWHDLDVAWNAERFHASQMIPSIPFFIVSAFAGIGLLLGLRSWRKWFVPYAIFLNQAVVMCLTYATDRQRVSLYPFFIFFGVLALSEIFRNLRTAAAAFSGAVVLAVLFSVPTELMKDDVYVWQGYEKIGPVTAEVVADRNAGAYENAAEKAGRALARGVWLREGGKPAELPASEKELAERAAKELETIREQSPSQRFDRAILLIDAGRLDEAESMLMMLHREGRKFVYMEGRIPIPAYHLGRIAQLRGDRKAAEAYFIEAFSLSPGEPAAIAQLACITGGEHYAEKIYRYYDDADALYFLGRACFEAGEYHRSADYFGRLSALAPEHTKTRIYLAASIGRVGNYRDAAGIYISTAGEHPGVVLIEDSILPIFSRWAKDGTAESLYWYGVVLRQYGRFDEAVQYLERSRKKGYAKAAEELFLIHQRIFQL